MSEFGFCCVMIRVQYNHYISEPDGVLRLEVQQTRSVNTSRDSQPIKFIISFQLLYNSSLQKLYTIHCSHSAKLHTSTCYGGNCWFPSCRCKGFSCCSFDFNFYLILNIFPLSPTKHFQVTH